MRITKQQLKDIINEEVASVIRQESNRRALSEARVRGPRGGLWSISADELISFAEAYSSLGDAVTEQLKDILESGADTDPDNVNPNAVEMIVRELGGLNEEIDESLAAWQDANDVPKRRKPRRGF